MMYVASERQHISCRRSPIRSHIPTYLTYLVKLSILHPARTVAADAPQAGEQMAPRVRRAP